MLQSFEVRGEPEAAAKRLPQLREEMKRLNIDGLLVPHDDEYLNEYTPPQFERLLWALSVAQNIRQSRLFTSLSR